MSYKTGIGKSLRGQRGDSGLTADMLGDLLSSPNFSLVGVDIQSSMFWSGTIDDTAIGSSIAGTGNFKDLVVGADGEGYIFHVYGNQPGSGLFWDPINAILSINGSIRSVRPSIFGNIQIADNEIKAINTNGSIALNPQGTGIVTVGGGLVGTAAGQLIFDKATNINLTANTGNTVISSVNGDLSLLAATVVKMNSNVPIVFGTGCTASIKGSSSGLTFADPIPTLTAICSNNWSDNGLSFKWMENGQEHTCFFGFIGSTQQLSFVPEATITILSDGTKRVSGHKGGFNVSSITGDPDITFNAPNGKVVFNTPTVQFGNGGTITTTPNGDFSINAVKDLKLNPTAGDVVMKTGKKLYMDNEKNQYIVASNTGLTMHSGNNPVNFSNSINLPVNAPIMWDNNPDNSIISDGLDLHLKARRYVLPEAGVAVKMAENIPFQFGDNVQNRIILDTTGKLNFNSASHLQLSSNGDILLNPASGHLNSSAELVTLGSNAEIAFGNSGNYVKSSTESGTVNIVSSQNLNLVSPNVSLNASNQIALASQIINIPANARLNLGDSIIYSDTTLDGALHLSDAVGVVIDKHLVVNGSFTVNGPFNQVTRVNTTFEDPILTLGKNSIWGDLTDRGLQFSYFDNTDSTEKNGFLGWKRQLNNGRFVLVKNGTNTNEIIDIHEFGDLQLAKLFSNSVISEAITTSLLSGDPNLLLKATDIFLSAVNSIQIPVDVPIISNNGKISYNSALDGWSIDSNSVNIPHGLLKISEAVIQQTNSSTLRIGDIPQIFLDATTVRIPKTLFFGNNQHTNITINDDESLRITAPTGINLDSITTFKAGYQLGNSQMTWNYDRPSGQILWENKVSDAPLNISIKGNIYDAEWKGQQIKLEFGGTGHIGAWHKWCIPFVSENADFLDEHVETFMYRKSTSTLLLNCQYSHGVNDGGLMDTEQTLVIGAGHVELQKNVLIVHSKNENLTFSTGVNSNGLFGLSGSNNVTTRRISDLVDHLLISQDGYFGFNIDQTQFTQILSNNPDAADRYFFNSNIKFTDSQWKIAYNSSDFINGFDGITINSNQSIHLRGNAVAYQWLHFLSPDSDHYINGTVIGDLNIRSPRNTWMRSPHTVICEKLCFHHHPITDECLSFMKFDEIDKSVTFCNNLGDIILNPKTAVTLPDGKAINIGSSGSITSSINGDLSISTTTGDIKLNPAANIYIPLNTDLSFGGITTISQSLSNFSIVGNLPSFFDLPKIVIPQSSPVVFNGKDGNSDQYIVGTQDGLMIYGGKEAVFHGDVKILGDLISSGRTNIPAVRDNVYVDTNILTLGAQIHEIESISATNLIQTTIGFKKPHNLQVTDRIEVMYSTPDIKGFYYVKAIPSNSSVVIDRVPNFENEDTDLINGIARSPLNTNSGVDLGIEVMWHTGNSSDTNSAQSSFFGFDRSSRRWTFLIDSHRTADIVNGTKGDIEIGTLYANALSSPILVSPLNAGEYMVSGSNFNITGGRINSTNIGLTDPAIGSFSQLIVRDGFIMQSSNLVTNLNADMLDNRHASEFLLRDGSLPMTNNWNMGPFDLTTTGGLISKELSSDHVLVADENGRITTKTGFIYKDSQLTVEKISGFSLQGALVGNGNTIQNAIVDDSSIINSNITIGTGKFLNVDNGDLTVNGSFDISGNGTLDLTSATLKLSNCQIPGSAVCGGTSQIDITGTSAFVTDGLYRRDFNAPYTVLVANEMGIPIPLVLSENTVLGRKDGLIVPISMDDMTSKKLFLDNSILKADTAENPIPLQIPEGTFVGRDFNGKIDALTIEKVKEMLSINVLSPEILYQFGALLRDGDNTVAGGGTMTGNLYTAFERFAIFTGQIRSLDITVETSYVSSKFVQSGGRVARCRLPNGKMDGHRKLIIFSSNTAQSALMVTGSLVAPETPQCYGLVFKYRGQSAFLQWDSVMSAWFIIGGAGAYATTLTQVMHNDFPDNLK